MTAKRRTAAMSKLGRVAARRARSSSAGASGAAALGGLLALCGDPALSAVRPDLGLDDAARVLVIVSEGVTDQALWDAIVARP